MMDRIDDLNSAFCINGLGVLEKACHLYGTSHSKASGLFATKSRLQIAMTSVCPTIRILSGTGPTLDAMSNDKSPLFRGNIRALRRLALPESVVVTVTSIG